SAGDHVQMILGFSIDPFLLVSGHIEEWGWDGLAFGRWRDVLRGRAVPAPGPLTLLKALSTVRSGGVPVCAAFPASIELALRFLSADGTNPWAVLLGGRPGKTVADFRRLW